MTITGLRGCAASAARRRLPKGHHSPASPALELRHAAPCEPFRVNGRCRIAYDRALRAAMNPDFEKLAARAAPAIFVVLWSTGFIATKYVLHNAEPLTYLAIRMAAGGGADGDHRRDRAAAMAGPDRHRPQRRCGHSGARILSRRHRDRDRAFDPGRALGADSGPAADPDLDAGEPLARRTRHAAAMERAAARARRRGADPARSPDERGGGLGLAGLGRVAGQHHPGHAVPAALLRPDRLARRQSRAVHRGHDFLRRRRVAVREQCRCTGPASSCWR